MNSLQTVHNFLCGFQINGKVIIGKGSPSDHVLATAGNFNADLIILSYKDVSKVKSALKKTMGMSTIDSVRMNANCPVLICRSGL